MGRTGESQCLLAAADDGDFLDAVVRSCPYTNEVLNAEIARVSSNVACFIELSWILPVLSETNLILNDNHYQIVLVLI